MEKRRTFTSTAVKNRWNAKHYDRFSVTVYKGSAEIVDKLAEPYGSRSEYIRHLINEDAQKRGFGDISGKLGGGGLERDVPEGAHEP